VQKLENEGAVAALLVLSRQGDSSAFEKFMDSTAHAALRLLRDLTCDHRVEPLLVSLYLELWNSLDSYDAAKTSPVQWIEAAVRDIVNRRARRPMGE
jgi:DNA-directed RNA polymerase specialized sigma24 family protein